MKTSRLFAALLYAAFAAAVCPGCATTSSSYEVLDSNVSQVQLRSFQTRAFDTADKQKMMQTVISTLQDLDFTVEKADYTLGTITGVKFVRGSIFKMTVSVRPRGDTQLLVRANAQYDLAAVESPGPYQDFFASLEKAIFLTAHQID